MCCLFGMLDYGQQLSTREKNRLLAVLSTQCEVRGTDATGIAYNSGGGLHIYKRPLPAHRMRFRIPGGVNAVMGHTRLTTQGSEKRNRNNHPFYGNAGGTAFALAHNGVLQNDVELRWRNGLPRTRIQTDSYIAVQLIEQKRALHLNSLKDMAEQVEGTFSFTVLDERDNLYFIKGDNPLCIYRYPRTGLLLYASTEDILVRALSRLKLTLEQPEQVVLACGEIARVDAAGAIDRCTFCTDNLFAGWYPWHRADYPRSHWHWPCFPASGETERGYVRELKSVAGHFGYSADDVDALLDEGFSPEELEEYFYCSGR